MSRVLDVSLAFWLMSLCCLAQSATQSVVPLPTPVNQSTSTQATAVPAPVAGEKPRLVEASASSSPLTLLAQAHALYHKGDFAGAIVQYQRYVQDHPQAPDGYAGIVRVYLRQKKVEDASQAADLGLARSDSPQMHTVRAEVWFRQGKIAEAEKEWVNVINSGYPEPRAYLGLARVRHALAMYKTERTLIEKAHALDPNDPEIQEEWIGTLSRAERIKYLESSLAGENNWDAEEREDTVNYLEYLKERAKRKSSVCRLVNQGRATETPLVPLLDDPRRLRGFGLVVALNGHKSPLLLDTGASGILVNRSVAEHAGISKISETKIMGIGRKGRRNAYIGIADSIKVGDLEFRDCPVEVMETRSVAGEAGLIGADVFENFLVDIDFPNRKLHLSELPKRPGEAEPKLALKTGEDNSDDDESSGSSDARQEKPAEKKESPPTFAGPQDRYVAPEMQSYTRIFRFGHDLLVPTTIGSVPYKLFLLDTGALTNFISPAAAREVTKVHKDSDTIVSGISGRVDQVFTANKAVLTFGRLRQENQDVTAFDTKPISDSVGTEVSGFLGFTTLGLLDIKIDYRDALIDFQYDKKRWER